MQVVPTLPAWAGTTRPLWELGERKLIAAEKPQSKARHEGPPDRTAQPCHQGVSPSPAPLLLPGAQPGCPSLHPHPQFSGVHVTRSVPCERVCRERAQLELPVLRLGSQPCPGLSPSPSAACPLPARAGTDPPCSAPGGGCSPQPAQGDGCPSSCRERQLSPFSNWEDKDTVVGPWLPLRLPPGLPGQGTADTGDACGAELFVGGGCGAPAA